jgi:hypothetical protein
MKKGRMGMLLSALSSKEKLENVIAGIFSQTSTIGIRMHTVNRRKLLREERIVPTRFGDVRVKAIIRDGREELLPEFEECRKIAEEQRIPLQEVYKLLAGEFREKT